MQQELVAKGPERLVALDGLRGLVALSVVVFHFFLGVLGERFPIYTNPLLAGLTSSNVGIFLMISGYVLTDGNWRLASKPRIHRQLVKRYFRLTIPMVASVLLVLALATAGLSWHLDASRLLGIETWLGNKLTMDLTLSGALYDATIGIYLPHSSLDSYNPLLWTMQAEFWGSLTLFAILLLDRRMSPYVMLVGALVVFALVKPIAMAILLGGLFALLRRDGHLEGALNELRQKGWLTWGYLVAAFGLGAFSQPPSAQQDLLAPIAAMLVMLPVLASPVLQRGLAARPMRFLGRLSLPLLLVQFPVLISFTSWAMLWLKSMDSFNLFTATLIAINSSLLCVLLAIAFLPVEAFTIAFCSWLSRLVFGRPSRWLTAPMPS